jgi:DNA-binding response OmpR family regulator
MSKATVLLIERRRAQHTSCANALKKRYTVISVPSGSQALQQAPSNAPSVVVLDAVSLQSPGTRIGRYLKSGLPGVPLIHLLSKAGESPADLVMVAPFTTRKLINNIERLLGETPDGNTIICGPFIMRPDERTLVANGQETDLTPKLAVLVEFFMRNPGITLDRKSLMERVWQTDYLGDTRTLDVHIRWFRRAIEVDPGHPVYLKTVRGVGYRLELPSVEPAAPVSAALELQNA